MYNRNRRGYSINENIKTERHKSYSEYSEAYHRDLFIWEFIVILAVGVVSFFAWMTGFWGHVLVWCEIVLIGVGVGYRITVWVMHHWYTMRQERINSRMIDTQLVSVYAHSKREVQDGSPRFTNFTADVMGAGIPKDEQIAIPNDVPHDDWEQAKDRQVYVAKMHDHKTWKQIEEQLGFSLQEGRTRRDRHQGRITRGETHDARNW